MNLIYELLSCIIKFSLQVCSWCSSHQDLTYQAMTRIYKAFRDTVRLLISGKWVGGWVCLVRACHGDFLQCCLNWLLVATSLTWRNLYSDSILTPFISHNMEALWLLEVKWAHYKSKIEKNVWESYGMMWGGGIRAAPAGRPSSSRKLNVAHALGYNHQSIKCLLKLNLQ